MVSADTDGVTATADCNRNRRTSAALQSIAKLNETGTKNNVKTVEAIKPPAAGKTKPQLVGYNVRGADIPILMQRAMALGIAAPGFCKRPDRPWEGMDYFSNAGEGVVDLMETFGIRGRGSPSLHELASAASIPGKMGVSGEQVLSLWQAGDIRGIVEYNEFDVISTYLVWLRGAHLAGFLTASAFAAEERLLDAMLSERIARGASHLQRYLDRWKGAAGATPA